MSPDLAHVALIAQLGSTLPLVGLIWFVQIVAYPLFALVEAGSGFRAYHRAHSARITWVVLPLMLTELIASAAFAWLRPSLLGWTGLALVLLIWAATGLVSVPRHEELARGFVQTAHTCLVRSNWIRTTAWTARGVMVLWLLMHA